MCLGFFFLCQSTLSSCGLPPEGRKEVDASEPPPSSCVVFFVTLCLIDGDVSVSAGGPCGVVVSGRGAVGWVTTDIAAVLSLLLLPLPLLQNATAAVVEFLLLEPVCQEVFLSFVSTYTYVCCFWSYSIFCVFFFRPLFGPFIFAHTRFVSFFLFISVLFGLRPCRKFSRLFGFARWQAHA